MYRPINCLLSSTTRDIYGPLKKALNKGNNKKTRIYRVYFLPSGEMSKAKAKFNAADRPGQSRGYLRDTKRGVKGENNASRTHSKAQTRNT